jgi:hypothetical protein
MTAIALTRRAQANAPRLRLGSKADSVLIAGGDPLARAAVLEDLSAIMPPSTTFEEAGAFWEVLVRAPSSRMVILSGDLDDVPAKSLMHTLGNRHPGLPVVSLDAAAPLAS